MGCPVVVEISNMSEGQIFSEGLLPLMSYMIIKGIIFVILFLLYWEQQNTFLWQVYREVWLEVSLFVKMN